MDAPPDHHAGASPRDRTPAGWRAAAGTVYVTKAVDDGNAVDDTVSVIDTATGTVTATIGVGNYPYGVAADPAAGSVYVANADDGTVSVIDTATSTVTATIPVGDGPGPPACTRSTRRRGHRADVIDPRVPNPNTTGAGAHDRGGGQGLRCGQPPRRYQILPA